jgi:hypothetical protein
LGGIVLTAITSFVQAEIMSKQMECVSKHYETQMQEHQTRLKELAALLTAADKSSTNEVQKRRNSG